MRRILALFLVFAVAIPALAWGKTEKVQESPLPNGLVVHEYKLKNGMQLLLIPDQSAPVFTYQVWFKVGSALERIDPRLQRTGLAHFFEHMMFRGTKTVPGSEFDKKLSAAGAIGQNASTWLDRTNYFESLPKEQLDLVFRLESDRMANLVINEKIFKTELGAVIGEYKMRQDMPGVVAYESVYSLAYEKHPYRWGVMGTLEDLNSFTVEDALYFYRTYYAPNNATLVLIGDFTLPKALALAEKYYGKIPSKKLPKVEMPVEPEQTAPRTRELTHPLANSNSLVFGHKIPDGRHSDIAALELVGAILSAGNGSILEQELVQTGIAGQVSAGPTRSRYPGLFTVIIQMAPGKSDEKAVSALNAALDRIRGGKISEAEIDRARNQYLLATYKELLNASTIGNNLGESLVNTDNYLRDFQLLGELKKVTAADLKRVVDAYLVDKGLNFVRVSPAALEKGTK